MCQDVAVPYVLPAEVDLVVGDDNRLCIRVLESQRRSGKDSAKRFGRIKRTNAVGYIEGDIELHRSQRNDGILQRVYREGIFPAQLIESGHSDVVIPCYPVNN